jgi:hypothetical protein
MRFDGKTNPQVATSLKIGELSGVTVPAHEGAGVTIMKFGADVDTLIKSMFAEELADEQMEAAVRAWLDPLWTYNYALREAAEKIMQDTTVTDKRGAIRESVTDYLRHVIELFNNQPEAATMADNTELELYKALAQMTDAHKAHYQSLPEADKADFLKLDGASRDLIVKSATVADETHTMLDGTVIAKSAVGASFAILKSQDAQLRKMREEQELAKAITAVSVDFGNLPGEPMAKAKAVMGLNALDAATRTWVTDTLKAADGLYKARREPAGDPAAVDTGEAPDAKLEKMAKAHAETHKVSFAAAYSEVMKTEEGRALYQQSLEG